MSIAQEMRERSYEFEWSAQCNPDCPNCPAIEAEGYAEDAERSKAKTSYGLLEIPTERIYSLDTECLVKVTERKGGSAEFVGSTGELGTPKRGITRAASDGSIQYFEEVPDLALLAKIDAMRDEPRKGGDKESLRIPKLPLDLIPPEAIEGEARVLAFGAKKYAAHNWKKGLPYAEVLAAIDRHSLAIKRGEDRDPETGELHTWHIKCEASFLGYFMTRPDIYMEFDNRVFKSYPLSYDPNVGQQVVK